MTKSSSSPRRTRVLYIDQTASMSGGELALLSLIQELDKQAFDPTVLLFEDGPLATKLQGLAEVVILPLDSSVREMRKEAVGGTSSMGFSKAFVLMGYIANLVQTVRRLRPDVVHTNSLKADILGGLAARLLRIPLIWHVRDRIADDYLPHRAVIVFRKLCRILPNYVIANSYATLETLFLPTGKPQCVVSSGFDVAAFAQVGAERAPLADAMKMGRVEIGIAGRISPWKGQDVFLRAAALIHAVFPATHFSIIGAALFGEADHEAKLHALTHELGLDDAVTFCGFQEDIATAIGALDVLVHASIIPEPLGQVIAQGMAAGKPVVAARGGGASETVRHGETGWLVPPNDPESLAGAVIHILRNPQAAQEVARRGQVTVKDEFDPRAVAERVEQVYRSLRR
ncbi:glycosyltransferase [Terriglobus roseus DSM 18391]|uniref:Glycosyltransferase n=1 Tax=Terriglobus roseus (strain DSM 18391 / NRRL B-41598 / KBS 63) TaxID=926566 RepID=I3ZFK6_TERRK|nr:glycosyltransferase family 4 protein [Terriglobus roseus]AFL88024.1 glycosyltransferase [Terriglobus roseus DSM 18391]